MGSAGRTWTAELRWPVVVGALAAAATVGAAARGCTVLTLRRPPQVLEAALTIPVAGVVVIGALTFAVALIRIVHRPHKDPDQLVHETDTPLHAQVVALASVLVLGLLLVAGPLALYLLVHPSRARSIRAPIPSPVSSVSPSATASSVVTRPAPQSFATAWWAPAAAALLVLVIAALVVARRRRRRRDEPRRDTAPADDLMDQAVVAGERAMATTGTDDVRAAVIACYEAMEGVLAPRGHARRPAQTPEELLNMVSRDVAMRPTRDAAARLVTLFGEARYSRHPMAETDRRSASLALTALQGTAVDDLAHDLAHDMAHETDGQP